MQKRAGRETTRNDKRDLIAIVIAIILAMLIMIPLIYTVNRDLNATNTSNLSYDKSNNRLR